MRKWIISFAALICFSVPGLVYGDELIILAPKGGDYAQGSPLTIKWDYTILSRPIPTNPLQRRIYVAVGSPSNPYVTTSKYDFTADITTQNYTWKINKATGTYAFHCLLAFTDPPIKASSQPFRVLAVSTVTPVKEVGTMTPVKEVGTMTPVKEVGTMTPVLPAGQIKKVPQELLNRIEVLSPEAGKTYYIGNEVSILWKTDNIKNYGYVNVQAHWPNGQTAAGSFQLPNTGSYKWPVNETKEVSFYFKFWTQDNEFLGKSGIFQVKFPPKLKKPIQMK
jgi:hypothetical protein